MRSNKDDKVIIEFYITIIFKFFKTLKKLVMHEIFYKHKQKKKYVNVTKHFLYRFLTKINNKNSLYFFFDNVLCFSAAMTIFSSVRIP